VTLIRWFGRRSLLAAVALAIMASFVGSGGHRTVTAANDPSCQTSFFVFTDPNNFGDVTTKGNLVIARNSGVLGEYTSGRFDGYTISGLQDLRLNQATGKASIAGSFVATSPDGESSITLRYRGKADLIAAVATGTFRATNGTGELEGFRANGRIEADYLGNFTFSGVDIGLC
jgi:hypothetical protein